MLSSNELEELERFWASIGAEEKAVVVDAVDSESAVGRASLGLPQALRASAVGVTQRRSSADVLSRRD